MYLEPSQKKGTQGKKGRKNPFICNVELKGKLTYLDYFGSCIIVV